MVVIWNAAMFRNPSDGVNCGDPRPADFDPRLCVLEYPLGSGRYLSLDEHGAISSAATEGTNERFQETNKGATTGTGMLMAERNGPTFNGPLLLPIAYGKI